MGDQTLAEAAQTAKSSVRGAAATAAAAAAMSFPFLNHSASTITHNLPPSVDDKPLARHRRKRTCPEDQNILEEAFKRDPKPNKEARLELVSKVSLGEKEVQIWFQNRRQSSRRKSRPLLPHEVAQYQQSRNGFAPAAVTTAPLAPRLSLGSDETEVDETLEDEDQAPIEPPMSYELGAEGLRERAEMLAAAAHELESANDSGELSRSVGYLANRRSASFQTLNSRDPTKRPMQAHERPARSLKKASSMVRLSLNAEGAAEVTTKDAASPSPPRPAQGSPVTADTPNLGSISINLTPTFARHSHKSSIGRSRDSRSWEFWCDKDTRSELENTAEKNAHGSAAGAIGLLRSASGRSILGSLPNKRNSTFLGQTESAKRSGPDHNRRPLKRSRTSQGRLQSSSSDLESGHNDAPVKLPPKLRYSGSAALYNPRGGSNKENIDPEWPRGMLYAPAARDVEADTHEDDSSVVASSERPLPMAAHKATTALDRDHDPEDEIETFMKSGRESRSSSAEEDLDCVQGLLSLSQGNWR